MAGGSINHPNWVVLVTALLCFLVFKAHPNKLGIKMHDLGHPFLYTTGPPCQCVQRTSRIVVQGSPARKIRQDAPGTKASVWLVLFVPQQPCARSERKTRRGIASRSRPPLGNGTDKENTWREQVPGRTVDAVLRISHRSDLRTTSWIRGYDQSFEQMDLCHRIRPAISQRNVNARSANVKKGARECAALIYVISTQQWPADFFAACEREH